MPHLLEAGVAFFILDNITFLCLHVVRSNCELLFSVEMSGLTRTVFVYESIQECGYHESGSQVRP